MGMNVSRFDSNWLNGLAKFERARDNFEAEFIAPLAEEVMLNMLANTPPVILSALQKRDPEGWKELTSTVIGGSNAK